MIHKTILLTQQDLEDILVCMGPSSMDDTRTRQLDLAYKLVPVLVEQINCLRELLDGVLHCPVCGGGGTHYEHGAIGDEVEAVNCPARERAIEALGKAEV